MIVSKNITKSFGSLQVLKGIDLTISKGEVVSIVGPSGAGKSTFLQILGTLSRPDSGEILIEGASVFSFNSDKIAGFRNRHIGFVFQFHHLLPEFTALENVCIPGYIAKDNRQAVEERAKELLRFLNLSDRMTHKPEELSGGEQQRVAVARALINNPDIILADEPSGNLDTHNRTELHKLFFKLRDEFGQTIVIVTHDDNLAEMSDRKLTMIDGMIQ
jgi:lipoprotein-releasing system ATP-binding protein